MIAAHEPRARSTHLRVSGPNQSARRSSRHTRRARCLRSRIPADSTDEFGSYWGHVYLNNRHHDPTLATFISVDPLVIQTGEPYIYGAANPITYSDPTGLCAGVEVFDQCVHANGGIEDMGTSRYRNWLAADGYDPTMVASHLEQLQMNDAVAAGDVHAAATSGGLGAHNAQKAISLFDWALDMGWIVESSTYGLQWHSCEEWCGASGVGTPISTYLTGDDSGAWDIAVADGLLGYGSQLYGGFSSRVGTCRSNSFAAGTLVLLADGSWVPIEDIEFGDEVWALDPGTGELAAKPVIDTIVGDGVKHLVAIDYGESTIVATAAHPFWVENRRAWIDAADLERGDVMRSPDGRSEVVEHISSWSEHATVFNLTVADIHTYFIIAGDDPILVHNCSVADVAAGLRDRVGRNRVSIETPNGRLSVDLQGGRHFQKGLGWVETPHVKFETRHVGPTGQSYTSGPVRPATHSDLRLVARILRDRGF